IRTRAHASSLQISFNRMNNCTDLHRCSRLKPILKKTIVLTCLYHPKKIADTASLSLCDVYQTQTLSGEDSVVWLFSLTCTCNEGTTPFPISEAPCPCPNFLSSFLEEYPLTPPLSLI